MSLAAELAAEIAPKDPTELVINSSRNERAPILQMSWVNKLVNGAPISMDQPACMALCAYSDKVVLSFNDRATIEWTDYDWEHPDVLALFERKVGDVGFE